MRKICKTFFLLFLTLLCLTVARINLIYSQPVWLKNGSYAIYRGKLHSVIFYDKEYWATDHHIEYFNAYLEWNVTEVGTDHLTVLIRLEILLNNSNKLFSGARSLKIDIHEQTIVDENLQGEPLLLWTLAKQTGDMINLPNHTQGTISKELKSFIITAGAFDTLLAEASYDIHIEEEEIHLEFVYGFEKDSGLLIHLAGGITDPIFRALGIKYLVGAFELEETNIPLKKAKPPALSDIIFILVGRIVIIIIVVTIGATIIINVLKKYKKQKVSQRSITESDLKT